MASEKKNFGFFCCFGWVRISVCLWIRLSKKKTTTKSVIDNLVCYTLFCFICLCSCGISPTDLALSAPDDVDTITARRVCHIIHRRGSCYFSFPYFCLFFYILNLFYTIKNNNNSKDGPEYGAEP